MQDLVTVESALKFGTTFYGCLPAHGQVDLATNEARSTLLTAGRPDAAVPVLFMRLKSGRLWETEEVVAESHMDRGKQYSQQVIGSKYVAQADRGGTAIVSVGKPDEE
jgi:hypothetical protein